MKYVFVKWSTQQPLNALPKCDLANCNSLTEFMLDYDYFQVNWFTWFLCYITPNEMITVQSLFRIII